MYSLAAVPRAAASVTQNETLISAHEVRERERERERNRETDKKTVKRDARALYLLLDRLLLVLLFLLRRGMMMI